MGTIGSATSGAAAYASTARAATPASSGTATAAATSAASGPSSPTAATGAIVPGDQLLRSRVFHTDDPEAKLPQYTTWNHPSSGSVSGFLTSDDRTRIAGLYEFAQRSGTPLSTIDHLAHDLGFYRSNEKNDNSSAGVSFDANLDPQVQVFSPADEATAQRILHSTAFTDSGLPTDFLEHELDPGRSSGPSMGMGRFERLLYDLSPSGDARAAQPAHVGERTPERFARQLADGTLSRQRAEILQARAADPMGGRTDWHLADPRDLFEKYEHRIEKASPMLQEDDKAMLGAMYADAEDKFGPDSEEMKKVDVLARRLAVARQTGMLVDPDRIKDDEKKSGHPRKSLAERGQDAYDKAIHERLHPHTVQVGFRGGVDDRA